MKSRFHRPITNLLAVAAALLSLVFASIAAPTRTKVPAAASPAATNAAAVQPQIPKSEFLIPSTPKEGKDPFFPNSTRLFASVVVKTNLQPVALGPELHLNGISGTPDRRLAIINNQTFAVNEEGEVPANRGRARIRCLEIKADSVLVDVGGEQRVLRLRPGF